VNYISNSCGAAYLQTCGRLPWEANANAKCKLSTIQRERERERKRKRNFKQTRSKFVNMQEQIPYPCYPCSLHCFLLKRLTFYCNFFLCNRIKIIYPKRDVVKSQHITMIITLLTIISRGSFCHSANHYSEAQLCS
jgi:hypothetical protein